MANKVAHWQFEEDDTVAILPKTGGVRIGLISETHEEETDSDDEDSDDSTPRLKPGQVRIEWYPAGKENATAAEKVCVYI